MIRHFVVLIPTPAVPVDLATVISEADRSTGFGTLLFQALKANTNDIFVAAKKDAPAGATSANHGFRVDSTDAVQPIAIRRGQGAALRLGDFSIAGTAGESLLIFGVED
jgi:hypothetical protein